MSDLLPGTYRHYKNKLYQVIGVATHSESAEQLVVYRPLYGEGGLWVRPLTMFCELVNVNGRDEPRFSRIDDSDSQIRTACHLPHTPFMKVDNPHFRA